MTWRTVARMEFRLARADGMVQWHAVLFAVLGLGVGAGLPALSSGDVAGAEVARSYAALALFVVPIAAIPTVHDRISGERARGRVCVPLSLPHSRTGLVVGVAAGRLAALGAPAVVGLVAAGVAATVAASFAPFAFLGVLVPVTLFVATWVGVCVGCSAVTRSTTLSLSAAGAAFLAAWVWSSVPSLVGGLLGAVGVDVGRTPALADAWGLLNPIAAYQGLLRAFGVGHGFGAPTSGDWVGVAVLLAWAALPVAAGARRFRTVDL